MIPKNNLGLKETKIESKKPNIVWFIIDSLRPEFLSIFGANVKPTFIDELIGKGLSFTNCITAAPYTIASVNAMFTGFYPSINKLNGWFKNTPQNLDRKVVTFADILKAEGYFTACFFPVKTRSYIPPYSFDKYELLSSTDEFPIDSYLSASSPKFLIFIFEEIHDTCCVNQATFTKQKYYKALSRIDRKIKYFYDKCCSESDIIVISPDHGIRVIDEPSAVHHKDEFVTGMYLTDKTIKTFFSIIAKNKIPSGLKIKEMMRTIDIAPTVLDVAGLPVLKGEGISLLPYLKKKKDLPELYAFSETGSMNTSPWKPDTWSVRTTKWKFILTKIKKYFNTSYKKELYDLENDPYEIENKAEKFPEISKELFKKINDMLLNNPKTVEDYYRENNFDYKKYLKSRTFPIKIKLKICFLTLINYKLFYRPKTQLGTAWSKIKSKILKKQ